MSNQVYPPAPTITGNPSIIIPADFLFIAGASVLILGATGLIKILITREINFLDKRMSEIEGKIESLEELIREVERNAVASDDFIRTSTTTDAKLDAIHRRLDYFISACIAKFEVRSND